MKQLIFLLAVMCICRISTGIDMPIHAGGDPVSYAFSNLYAKSSSTDGHDVRITMFFGDMLDFGEGFRINFYADNNSTTPFDTVDYYHPGGTFPGATLPFSSVSLNRGNHSPLFSNWRNDLEGRIEVQMLSGSISIYRIQVTVSDLAGMYYFGRFHTPELQNTFTSNGTPYQWLIDLGYSSDWELADLDDLDEDGFVNWQEYIADTNPNDDSDFLEIDHSEGTMSFFSSTSCLYRINYCDNLQTKNWQFLTNAIAGTGAVISIPFPYTAPVRYYQLEAERQD